MKVWRFYKVPEDKEVAIKDYVLYAITNKKEFADRFKIERNMNLFIMKKSEVTKEKFVEFANENQGCLLDLYYYETKEEMENGFYGRKRVSILSTMNEHENSSSDNVESEVLSIGYYDGIPDPKKIYKESLYEALRVFQYVAAYKMFSSVMMDKEYDAPDLYVDELGMFVSMYQYTFK